MAGTRAAIRGLVDLYRAPVGYDPTRVTLAQLYLPIGSYTTWPDLAGRTVADLSSVLAGATA